MKKQKHTFFKTAKQGLYFFSLFLLLFLSLFIYLKSLKDFTSIPRLPKMMGSFSLGLLMFLGSLALIFLLILLHRLFLRLSLKNHRRILLVCSAAAVFLQFGLLFALKPVLRYDHLKVFDEALGVLRTKELSLTAHEGYFGYYPFNIPITLLHAGILKIFTVLGIGESHFMIMLQCFYAIAIDSAVAAAYFIVKKLSNERTALLLLLICLLHPILYVCASGCYTTTLMIPLLMWNLFLIISFLSEKNPRRKIILGILLGAAIVFGVKIRATVLITVIAFAGYLIVHAKNEFTFFENRKQIITLTAAIGIGGVLCFSGLYLAESNYVKGDYSETQLPPAYYFMFAANPEALGHYSESDFEMIIGYDTLAEKKEISKTLLKERLNSFGPSGVLKLAGVKIENTWTDGTEDYADFLTTSRSYRRMHDLIAGNRADLFALYCHMYHLSITGMLIVCIILFFKSKQCSTPYYLILLNLLGGILFHILWESYYVYSISFLPLMLIAASDGLAFLTAQPVFKKQAAAPIGFVLTALSSVFLLLPHTGKLWKQPAGSRSNVIIQDMYDGNDLLPLLKGEAVTQSFRTDKPFDHIAVRVLNSDQENNHSSYVIQLIDEKGNELAMRSFGGSEIPNKDYCYLKFPVIVPDGMQNYTIRIAALDADSKNCLIFPYYQTGNYDIYTEGSMKGLNSNRKSDLNFLVFYVTPENSSS